MYLLLCCLYLASIYYRSEAVSLTCDNTTDVCPGTELTCTCSVQYSFFELVWRLPGSRTISIDDKGEFTVNVTTDGIFVAIVTNNTGGVLESMLIYTATRSLVNDTIECSSFRMSVSATIADMFAG